MSRRVFACKNFKGLWPVPVAAVIVATDARAADNLLRAELARRGLPQPDNHVLEFDEIDTETTGVTILSLGDY